MTGHTDPDIKAAWDEAQHALANLLRGYVVEHQADTLAKRFIDGLEVRGWRPPLRPPHDLIAQARARRQQEGR
jgi:hypothetical protein